jgi:hypothetical protein
MTLNPVCENVETKQGVPLTVTGVAQVICVLEDIAIFFTEKLFKFVLFVATYGFYI